MTIRNNFLSRKTFQITFIFLVLLNVTNAAWSQAEGDHYQLSLVQNSVNSFKVSPDSNNVVMLDGGLKANKIEGDFFRGISTQQQGVQGDYEISYDSKFVIYRALREGSSAVFDLYSVPILGGEPNKLNISLPATKSVVSFKVSSDSQRIAYVATENSIKAELYSVLIEGGSSTRVNTPLALGNTLGVRGYYFSPDSSQIVYGLGISNDTIIVPNDIRPREIYIVPSEGGSSRKLHGDLGLLVGGFSNEFLAADGVGFTRDGDSFIFEVRTLPRPNIPPRFQNITTQLFIVNIAGSSPIALTNRQGLLSKAVFHQDGRHLLVLSGNTLPKFLQVIDLEFVNAMKIIKLPSESNSPSFGVADFELSGDGKHLALRSVVNRQFFEFRWSEIFIYDFDTEEISVAFTNEAGLKIGFGFSPNGRTLFSYAFGENVLAYNVASRSVKALNRIGGEFKGATPFGIAFPPDSSALVYPRSSSTGKINFVRTETLSPNNSVLLNNKNDLGLMNRFDYQFTESGSHFVFRSNNVVFAVEGWSAPKKPLIIGAIYCLLIDDCEESD